MPAYRISGQKASDAEAYQRDEAIPWTVLVDDLAGSVHRAYGGLTNPAYLIGTDGRVAFYAPTTGVPTLHRAVHELLAAGGRGVVAGGRDLIPHLLAAFTDGWRAIERGLPQSAADLSTAAPGSVALLRLGVRVRPVLAPLTLRAEPLSGKAKLSLGVLIVALLGRSRARHRRRTNGTLRWNEPGAAATGRWVTPDASQLRRECEHAAEQGWGVEVDQVRSTAALLPQTGSLSGPAAR